MEKYLYGEKIIYDKSVEVYAEIIKQFRIFFDDCVDEPFKSIIGAKNISTKQFFQMLSEMYEDRMGVCLEMAVEVLYKKGLEYANVEEFYDEYGDSFTHFQENMAPLVEQCGLLEQQYHQNLDYQQLEEMSRGRWVGGGFGLKGAIKGAVTAKALNVGTDILRSVISPDNKAALSSDYRRKTDSLLGSKKSYQLICNAFYQDIIGVANCVMEELVNRGIEKPLPFDAVKAKALLKNTLKYKNPSPEDMRHVIVTCLRLDPFCKDVYDYLWENDGDNSDVIKFARSFMMMPKRMIEDRANALINMPEVDMEAILSKLEACRKWELETGERFYGEIERLLERLLDYAKKDNSVVESILKRLDCYGNTKNGYSNFGKLEAKNISVKFSNSSKSNQNVYDTLMEYIKIKSVYNTPILRHILETIFYLQKSMNDGIIERIAEMLHTRWEEIVSPDNDSIDIYSCLNCNVWIRLTPLTEGCAYPTFNGEAEYIDFLVDIQRWFQRATFIWKNAPKPNKTVDSIAGAIRRNIESMIKEGRCTIYYYTDDGKRIAKARDFPKPFLDFFESILNCLDGKTECIPDEVIDFSEALQAEKTSSIEQDKKKVPVIKNKLAQDNSNTNKPQKKHGFVIGMVSVCVVAFLCSLLMPKNDKQTRNESGKTEASTTGVIVEEKQNEIKDMPVWSFEYLVQYVKSNDIPLLQFSSEHDRLEKKIAELEGNKPCYVKGDESSGFKFDDQSSGNAPEWLYLGSLKNERPDGVGVLYKIRNLQSDVDPSYIYQFAYKGDFQKGKYSGYGMQYDYIGDVMGFSNFDSLKEFIKKQDDPQKCIIDYFNPLGYEGHFDGGKYDGQGNYFESPGYYYILNGYVKSQHDLDVLSNELKDNWRFIIGEYKKDKKVGHFQEYYGSSLLFDGEYEADEKNGNGIDYYSQNNQIMYKGGYKNGEYSGEGVLYDKSGNVVCSGEWIRGVCGTFKMNDYLTEMFVDEANEQSARIIEKLKQGSELDNIPEESEELESQQSNVMNEGDYILPDVDTRYYSGDEISVLSKEMLRLARNEVYARHGRKFNTVDLNEYFSTKPWYHGSVSAEEFDDSCLNIYEMANLDLLKKIENGGQLSDAGTANLPEYITGSSTQLGIQDVANKQYLSTDGNVLMEVSSSGESSASIEIYAGDESVWEGEADRYQTLPNGGLGVTIVGTNLVTGEYDYLDLEWSSAQESASPVVMHDNDTINISGTYNVLQ